MSELDPQAKDLIGLALEGEGPTSSERSRLRGVVLARVGAGVAVLSTVSGTAAATATGAGSTLALGLAAKVVVAVALVGAVGAGGYAAVSIHRTKIASGAARPSGQATAPVIGAPAPAVSLRPPVGPGVEPTRDSPPVSEETPAAAAPALLSLASARPVSTARAPSEIAAGSTPPNRTAPLPDRSLDEETRALRSAFADLRDGHANRALAAIDAQESRFAGGALAEERAAARVVTLCALGRTDEARADASRFLGAHPHSLLAGRIIASCGGSEAAGPSAEP